jgi:hypothetical protein
LLSLALVDGTIGAHRLKRQKAARFNEFVQIAAGLVHDFACEISE